MNDDDFTRLVVAIIAVFVVVGCFVYSEGRRASCISECRAQGTSADSCSWMCRVGW